MASDPTPSDGFINKTVTVYVGDYTGTKVKDSDLPDILAETDPDFEFVGALDANSVVVTPRGLGSRWSRQSSHDNGDEFAAGYSQNTEAATLAGTWLEPLNDTLTEWITGKTRDVDGVISLTPSTGHKAAIVLATDADGNIEGYHFPYAVGAFAGGINLNVTDASSVVGVPFTISGDSDPTLGEPLFSVRYRAES